MRRLGGLHRFMQWDGPILTDSGGYQVFSLRDTAKIDDGGVAFRSIYDGSKHVFTPERAMAEQQALGADFIMCFDQCPPGTATEAEVADAVGRTSRVGGALQARPPGARAAWAPTARRCCWASCRAACIPHLRRQSAERLLEIGFPGYAIGGLTVGEDRNAMLETTVADRVAAARGPAALLHGHRRPGGAPRGDRARGGHLRLRAAHADGPHGHGLHVRTGG